MSGFDTYGTQGNVGKPTLGERIKEALPGTEGHHGHGHHHHQETAAGGGMGGLGSGVMGAGGHHHHHAAGGGLMDDAKAGSRRDGSSAYIPGMGGATQSSYTTGERIKESIPGTREHEAAYGTAGGHHGGHGGMDAVMAHVPGTEAHRAEHMGMNPSHYNSSGMGTMGTEHNTWAGTRDTHHAHGHGTGEMGRGLSPGTGTGYTEGGRETLGHKIKKHVPGTHEHVEYEADKIRQANAL